MTLYADLRWPAFAERYACDPHAFAVDVCGVAIPDQLLGALPHLDASRLMLHNAGSQEQQGVVLAVLALWHITTTPDSLTMLSSPADSASETNRAIAQLHKHIRTGRFYWLARGIKHRATGWAVEGRLGSAIKMRKASARYPEALAGEYAQRLLWLVEGGEKLPATCLGVIGSTMVYEGNALVIAHDWHVPEFTMNWIRGHGYPLVDLEQSQAPTYAEQRARHQDDMRHFVELVAGKPLSSHQAALLATLVQSAPVAQTPR